MTAGWNSALRLAVFWALAVAAQWAAGAYRTDIAANPDEPAHIVSGLMARQFLTSGWDRGALEFARDYYWRYPKVAIGHWPPLFYLEQALWSLAFPTTRNSLLAMIALQFAILAAILTSALRSRFGEALGWAGGLGLAMLPGVASASLEVVAEIAAAIPLLLAVLSWARFLDTGRAASAAAFGLCAAAAILTKPTAVVLAGVPLLSAWLAGRPELVRRGSFWMPAALVGILCLPWFAVAPGGMHERVAALGGPALVTRRFAPVTWTAQFGWPVAVLASIGLVLLLCRRIKGSRLDGLSASVVGLSIPAALAPLAIHAWEARHLVETAPAFVLLAVSGAAWIAAWLPFKAPAAWILALASIAGTGGSLTWLCQGGPAGYRELASAIASGALGPARSILVSGDSRAEGSFIAEMALREPRPGRFVVRGSKLFVDATWMGEVKRIRAAVPEEVDALLLATHVEIVVLDRARPAPYGYQALLEQAVAARPDQWRAVALDTPPGGLAAFRRAGAPEISDGQRKALLQAVLPEPIP
jgi:hypothetical protein